MYTTLRRLGSRQSQSAGTTMSLVEAEMKTNLDNIHDKEEITHDSTLNKENTTQDNHHDKEETFNDNPHDMGKTTHDSTPEKEKTPNDNPHDKKEKIHDNTHDKSIYDKEGTTQLQLPSFYTARSLKQYIQVVCLTMTLA